MNRGAGKGEEFDLINAARVSFFCADWTENWLIRRAKSLIGNLISQHQY